MASVASSEALGGIGGFMMAESEAGEEGVEELRDDISPATPSVQTPSVTRSSTSSPPDSSLTSHEPQTSEVEPDPEDWDIYGDYARESLYFKSPQEARFSVGEGAIHAKAILELAQVPITPKNAKPETRIEAFGGGSLAIEGGSLATQLRLRIQRERERAEEDETDDMPAAESSVPTEVPQSSQLVEQAESPEPVAPIEHDEPIHLVHEEEPVQPESPVESRIVVDSPVSEEPQAVSISAEPEAVSGPPETISVEEISFQTVTEPITHMEPPNQVIFTAPTPATESSLLLASPLPLDDSFLESPNLGPPGDSPNLVPPHRSPSMPQWSPGSPASPHSIAATRQAVEAARTPEGRPRGMTLVGRMEADLRAAKGPVPITFLIGGPGAIPSALDVGHAHKTLKEPIGLGLPGRGSSMDRRAISPLSPELPDDLREIRNSPSRFPIPPRPIRSFTAAPPEPVTPVPGFLPRPRSRSFGAAVAKTLGRKTPPPPPINTTPPLPTMPSPAPSKRSLFKRNVDSPQSPQMPTPVSQSASSTSLSLPPESARSTSFSFRSSTSVKTPRQVSRTLPLPSPVSHKDYAEETVKADGMDFELVQPKKSAVSPNGSASGEDARPPLERKSTVGSELSTSSSRPLPKTDEWGFLKDSSPVPEIFGGRVGAGKNREGEQKWLSIIATPLRAGTAPPKKVRKLVLDAGIPASLRGRVWAWFMSGQMSARVPGLYQELLDHDKGQADEQIERDVRSGWSDHSIFSEPTSPGRQDLRSLLRAYSNFAPDGYRPEMSLLAGTLLIHCVVEDAFWLLSGLINGVLRDYFAKDQSGLRVDSEVFRRVVEGSEKDVAALFRQVQIQPGIFVEKWYKTLFIRVLPWPTALRVIDTVVSEGPRFLLITALTILTVSKDRLLALPKTRPDITAYLDDLPQDSLLLPETFFRAADKVRFKDDDLSKLRTGVKKDLGLV
ncbi:rab-GTPase-TBC domain-domain-containing protein [Naematelia encephala]|uniref:Rab-GTPase-TBC domain-domain-containing protein n=1 Tax=Naematelia encephala TaxID=71784 RepID=A0A1Y2AUQ9_9TREE|nr:rab-GTPase-TBC domain-domain-containing protein [Naematelia encephala]